MRKGELLNSEIVSLLAKLGHTDQITIGDAGLPIPDDCQRIDLALIKGIPSFLEVLDAVLSDMVIEHILLADEIQTLNPEIHRAVLARVQKIEEKHGKNINIEYVSHMAFKLRVQKTKAVIRTGEVTPYANIVLSSGVVF